MGAPLHRQLHRPAIDPITTRNPTCGHALFPRITRLDRQLFQGLTALARLWLSHNRIDLIGCLALTQLTSLAELRMGGNPSRCGLAASNASGTDIIDIDPSTETDAARLSCSCTDVRKPLPPRSEALHHYRLARRLPLRKGVLYVCLGKRIPQQVLPMSAAAAPTCGVAMPSRWHPKSMADVQCSALVRCE